MVGKEKEEKNITLADVIDVKFLQEFQDVFAKTMGISSIIIGDNGPITQPSNFTKFCTKYSRATIEDIDKCNSCGTKWGKIAAQKGGATFYTCHSGLTAFAVPIMVGREHIASILGGQVFTEKPNEEDFRKIAKESGIDENEYLEALRDVKVFSMEEIKAVSNLLYSIANTISEVSLKNFELIKRNKVESLYRRITEVIRSSLDINETLTYICDELAQLFNVQRATIIEYPDKNDFSKFVVRREYKSRDDIKGILNNKNFNFKVGEIWAKTLENDGESLAIDNIKESDMPDFFKENYTSIGQKSIAIAPIKRDSSKWGVIILSEYDYYRHWTDEDINLLKTISDQIYIAINQAELYNVLKQTTANQNAILNNMPFMAWLKDTKGRLLAINDKFAQMCNLNMENIIGKTDLDFFPKENAESYINDDNLVMEKRQTISKIELISGPEGERWHETIKSPVIDDNGDVIGTVGISSDITQKQESELELVRRQEQIIKAAEKESLLRNIFETMRSSLDINHIKSKIVAEIGRTLNADLCFIVNYNSADDFFYVDEYSEYRSSDEVVSFIGADNKNSKFKWFIDSYKNHKETTFANVEEFIAINNLQDAPEGELLRESNIKSSYEIPLYYANNLLGYILIDYTKDYKALDENDMEFLRLIAAQAGIALHQADLYKKMQEQAVREEFIGSIIAKAISTFDLKEIINSIVTKAGILFNADRCLYVEYDPEHNSNHPIKDYTEYLSSSNIKSHTISMPDKAITDRLIQLLKERKSLVINNIYEVDLLEETKHMLIDDLSVKSILNVPIYYGDISYGSLNFHYVQNFKKFTQDDIELAQAIANQSALVIHQTKLYSTLIKNEEYIRTVLDSIQDGIVTINDDFIIESCNPSIESIWGYSTSEVIGKTLDILLKHSCTTENELACLSTITLGIKKDGQEFPVEIDISKINFKDKNLTLLVIRDITERKKIEKMKSEFVSTVSHELRTPLTSIKGSLGLVTSGVFGTFPEKVTDLINIANNNCSRLTNLINDILDLEKIKAGKYEFIYEELGINSLIEHSIVLNQSYIDQFGMKVKVFPTSEEVYIKADKNRILQVISNLISNAVKFSNHGGEVTIISEITNDNVKVSFIDKGIGIPDDSKHKIFQSFSQVDSSDTRSKGGTGLGLSICKLIIENMNGKIDFDSKAGKGSTFFFTLPTIAKGSFVKPDGKEVKELDIDTEAW